MNKEMILLLIIPLLSVLLNVMVHMWRIRVAKTDFNHSLSFIIWAGLTMLAAWFIYKDFSMLSSAALLYFGIRLGIFDPLLNVSTGKNWNYYNPKGSSIIDRNLGKWKANERNRIYTAIASIGVGVMLSFNYFYEVGLNEQAANTFAIIFAFAFLVFIYRHLQLRKKIEGEIESWRKDHR